MSGERYIKQALIAALVDHPDQDKYKTRAFSGANLEKVMEALSQQKQSLTKADFLTPDDDGKYIIDTPGFWKNFAKVLDIVTKSGEKFTFDDFTKPLTRDDYRNEQRDLLDSARQNNGLGQIFAADVWQGRFDEMERLWYRVPIPARRDLFRNEGYLDPALKRGLLKAEGRTCPEDGLTAAGVTRGDFFSMFEARGNFEEVQRKLSTAGDYLRKDYLLLPDNNGDTIFYNGGAWDKFAQMSSELKTRGEKFEVADYVRQVGTRPNILTRAFERRALDKVFAPEQWVDRLPDMLELWKNMREGWKITPMTARDFDNAYAEAENRTFAPKADFAHVQSKQSLLSPLNPGAGAPVLPLGLKAFWDDYAANAARLPANAGLTVADLRTTSGHLGKSVLMNAVKFGHFDKVLDISRASSQPVTLDDFLSKDRHGNTLLNQLAERNQLAQAFAPDLWAGRVAEMKTLWSNVRVNDRAQLDFQQAEVAAKQATLKLGAKEKFKLKPNRNLGGPG
jgi:hypothetical protein